MSKFPVCSSVLSPEALVEQVLPGYALPEPLHCRLISRGMNDVYHVAAGAETFFMRVTGHGWRSREEVAGEVAPTDYLHVRALAVSPVGTRSNGKLPARIA